MSEEEAIEKHGHVVEEKRWSIRGIRHADGSTFHRRDNSGFTIYELLGIVEHIRVDLLDQVTGRMKPDITVRTAVKPRGTIDNGEST